MSDDMNLTFPVPPHPPKNVVTFVVSPRETAVLCSAVTFIPALQRNGCNLC